MALTRPARSARPTTDRENLLRNAGWDIRRFTYEQVMHEGPSVVRAVEATRAEATARFSDNP